MFLKRIARLAPALTQTRCASSFRPSPSPPKLPAEQQSEFERLQRDASVSSAFQPTPEAVETQAKTVPPQQTDDMNPGFRRGAKPEFDGDVNPKTGEVGGPKNDPLRWKGDWSYNGRVTDF